MLRTVEAIIDNHGHVQWLDDVHWSGSHRVLITLLDTVPAIDETLRISEPALAEDWLKESEDTAWAHLQPGA